VTGISVIAPAPHEAATIAGALARFREPEVLDVIEGRG
jgi:hypothetical protein